MANKADKKQSRGQIPLYRTWHPGNEPEEDGREIGSFDVGTAAANQAAYFYRHQEGHESSWPVTFHVRDPADNKVYAVSVDLEMEPSFTAGKPEEVP